MCETVIESLPLCGPVIDNVSHASFVMTTEETHQLSCEPESKCG